jgi:hypothetical protein
MSDRNTSAPAETADARPEDIRSIANDLPNDAFGFEDDDDAGSEGEGGERQEPARTERARQQPRGEGGRFAPQGDPEEGDGEAEPGEEGQGEAEGEAEQADDGTDADTEAKADDEKDDKGKKQEASVYISIDGQNYSAEDVRRGFLRQDDYTRKTQEIAQHRQTIQQEAQRIQAHEQELVGVLDIAVAALRDTLPAQPDMALLDTDPVAYSRQMAQHQAGVQRLQALAAQQQQVGQRQTAQQQEQTRQQQEQERRSLIEAQNTLRQKMPALFTEQGKVEFLTRVEKYGEKLGLGRGDIDMIQDPRAFPVLDMAMKYLDLQAKKPAAVDRVKSAPPIRPAARPGAGTREGQVRRDADQRFRQNPDIKSALATGVLDDVFG